MELAHRVALVTGAASGLGRATALHLAGRGATVYGLDLDRAFEGVETIDSVHNVPCDVTSAEQVERAVAAILANDPLDIAVNCAGIAPMSRVIARDGTVDIEPFERAVLINLIGTYTVLAHAAQAMTHNRPDQNGQRGVIVNTASIAAFEGQVGQSGYAASKAGVVGLTITAARDLAQHGVRVCTIAPGIIDTPMLATLSEPVRDGLAASVPFPHRLGDPQEYARMVEMIIQHDYLNGETIRLDGALRMGPR
jgi:NAD(P)-dependent dehydrogenase (short-subunit alcohol dehydrogenase family)